MTVNSCDGNSAKKMPHQSGHRTRNSKSREHKASADDYVNSSHLFKVSQLSLRQREIQQQQDQHSIQYSSYDPSKVVIFDPGL